MSSFRTFFSEMIRHERKRVLAGLACAFVSAGGLGGGLLALAPPLRLLLDPNSSSTLRELAGRRRARVHAATLVGGLGAPRNLGRRADPVWGVACGHGGGIGGQLCPSGIDHDGMRSCDQPDTGPGVCPFDSS